jgi:HEPN domain-containing protein
MKKQNFKVNPEFMSDVLTKQFEHIFYHRPNKILLKLSDDFIKCAKEDLESCKLLYANKKYAHSTYFLQQAAEKTTKGFVLYFGKFTKNDMYTIRHNSVKAFIMLLDRMENLTFSMKSLYPSIKTDSSYLKKILKDSKKRVELAKSNYEIFKLMFKFQNNCHKKLKNSLEDIHTLLAPYDISKTLQKSLKDLSLDEMNEEIKNQDSSEILKKHFNKENTLNFLNRAIYFALLYLIAAYTFPHADFTRYPDRDIKPWEYTQEMGIVKATPELILQLKKIIKNLEE